MPDLAAGDFPDMPCGVPEPPTAREVALARAARLLREEMRARDRFYETSPLGGEVVAYLRQKRKALTRASYRDYDSVLGEFCVHHVDLTLADFEPPVGAERLEEYLDLRYGERAPRTYNKVLSVLADFFKWARLRERMVGDPTLTINRARKREIHRETFRADLVRAIIAGQESARDRLAVRLLLDYGLRKGEVRAVQYKHFDHVQRRLTVFRKGGKVRTLPIPSPPFWNDLERHIMEVEAEPGHYLMCRTKTTPTGAPDARGKRPTGKVTRIPDKPLSDHGMHRWWYGCLARAGVVAPGTSSGERMHKARHTAGQRVLDATGNLKAVQTLLGHASIQTTGDSYVDWDLDALARTMADVLGEDG